MRQESARSRGAVLNCSGTMRGRLPKDNVRPQGESSLVHWRNLIVATDPRRPTRLMAGIALFGLAAFMGPARAAAQSPPTPCADDAFRAFDYWTGDWVVRNAEGAEVGRNTVSRRSNGCALLEEWRAANGPTGTSLNFYDPADGKWRQEWVGGGGQLLHLVGGPVEGVMTLEGRRETPRGAVQDRIQWIPLDDGRVEQRWEISTDAGSTWQLAFQGYYERASGA